MGHKENEITKAAAALKMVVITGKVVTADALHTQRRLSSQILEQGGEYVFPVKENQPGLYKSIQALFAPDLPKPGFGKIQTDFLSAQKVNKGHGRIEIRTIHTSEMLNPYSSWPGLAQVYHLERQFQWWRSGRCHRTSQQVELGIASLTRTEVSASRLLDLRRAHWGIETRLHYRRDVTFQEDATRMTIGHTGKVMACINNLVIALIRQAKFENAARARPDRDGIYWRRGCVCSMEGAAKMAHAEKTVVINRPVESVFDFVLNGANNKLWRASVLDVRPLSEAPYGLGSRFEQELKGPTGRIPGDYEITECKPYERIQFQVTAGPARPTGIYRFQRQDAATAVTLGTGLPAQRDIKADELRR